MWLSVLRPMFKSPDVRPRRAVVRSSACVCHVLRNARPQQDMRIASENIPVVILPSLSAATATAYSREIHKLACGTIVLFLLFKWISHVACPLVSLTGLLFIVGVCHVLLFSLCRRQPSCWLNDTVVYAFLVEFPPSKSSTPIVRFWLLILI